METFDSPVIAMIALAVTYPVSLLIALKHSLATAISYSNNRCVQVSNAYIHLGTVNSHQRFFQRLRCLIQTDMTTG